MHRAESILQVLTAQLTGLATTGSNVYRAYAQISAVPALTVKMGDDIAVAEQSNAMMDREISILIEATAQANSTTDTTLNQIRAEVYAAIQASPTLGMAYVINTTFEQDDAPEQRDNSKPIVKQLMRYNIRYRHSMTSTEV